jgi:hypothetical protein
VQAALDHHAEDAARAGGDLRGHVLRDLDLALVRLLAVGVAALANERAQSNAAGQEVLKLKTSWRDGTTHLVMSPLEVMRRRVELPLCGRQTC